MNESNQPHEPHQPNESAEPRGPVSESVGKISEAEWLEIAGEYEAMLREEGVGPLPQSGDASAATLEPHEIAGRASSQRPVDNDATEASAEPSLPPTPFPPAESIGGLPTDPRSGASAWGWSLRPLDVRLQMPVAVKVLRRSACSITRCPTVCQRSKGRGSAVPSAYRAGVCDGRLSRFSLLRHAVHRRLRSVRLHSTNESLEEDVERSKQRHPPGIGYPEARKL